MIIMIYLGVTFFVLSFILAKVVLSLPLHKCQMAWSIVSVWGILCAVSSVFLYAIWFNPGATVSWFYWSLWWIFGMSFPGQAYLNWQQILLWRRGLRDRDKQILVLKSQLELEQIVKKTKRYFITEQVN